MSTIPTLVRIQTAITRYALPVVLALGNLGNLFMIGVYLHKKFRTNPCAIYLIASSFFSLMGANWSIIPIVYALDNYDLVNNSLVLCRLRGYILQTCGQCFRFILVLRCADRYALSSTRVSIRALSRSQIAYRAIAIVVAIWSVLSSQLLIWETIENGRCGVYGLFGQIFTIYATVCGSCLPLLLMIVVSILLKKNLHQLRSRVHSLDNNNNYRLNKRDTSLMRLVLFEVLVYVVCTFMFPVMQVYSQATASMASSKSVERKQIESFLIFISQSLLVYLNYSTTFYVYIITSKAFRNEVKQLVMVCIQKLHRNAPTHENRLVTAIRAPTRQQPQITTVV